MAWHANEILERPPEIFCEIRGNFRDSVCAYMYVLRVPVPVRSSAGSSISSAAAASLPSSLSRRVDLPRKQRNGQVQELRFIFVCESIFFPR